MLTSLDISAQLVINATVFTGLLIIILYHLVPNDKKPEWFPKWLIKKEKE